MIANSENTNRRKMKPPSFGTAQDFGISFLQPKEEEHTLVLQQPIELQGHPFKLALVQALPTDQPYDAQALYFSSGDSPPPIPTAATNVPIPERMPLLDVEPPATNSGLASRDSEPLILHESAIMGGEECSVIENTFELKRDLAELSFDGREESFDIPWSS